MFGQLTTLCLRLIGRSAKHSIHSIIGFALIVTIVITVSGIITGVSTSIYEITAQSTPSFQFSMRMIDSENKITNDIIETLYLGDFESVLPVVKTRANFSANGKLLQTELIGTNLTTLTSFYSWVYMLEGYVPHSNQTPIECIQGADIRGYFTSNITYTLLTENQSGACKIVGTITGVAELQQTIMVHINDFKTIIGESETDLGFSEVKIKVKESISLVDFEKILSDLLGNNYKDILVWKEQQPEIYTNTIFKEILAKLELLYIFLFVLVMIRLYHNITWFVITYERTFLIMRAIGLSRERLLLLMILLGLIVGNIGFFMGVLIGIILPPMVLSILTAVLNVRFVVTLAPISIIAPLWILSMIITTGATIIPSLKISRTSPSKISMLIKEK
ncbi:MAG: FtsX-like permease family protein [Promethearchaeota archaeon]